MAAPKKLLIAHGAVWLRRPRGFTLVELLVVVAIIGLLIGLVVPAFHSVQLAGKKTVEMSAARQLMTAYMAYSAAHAGRLLPGYLETGVQAFDRNGRPITGGSLDIAKRRYLFRLAPYFNFDFHGLFVNEHAEVLERLEYQDHEMYLYAASLSPSLGLNTEWIGGDSSAYGFLEPDHPIRAVLDFDRFYVAVDSHVIHSDRLLVFASARGVDPENSIARTVEGFYKVTSPYFTEFTGIRWTERFNTADQPVRYGFLSPRHEGNAVIAFMDSHVDLRSAEELRDMRYWANWATKPDWRLPRRPPPPEQ